MKEHSSDAALFWWDVKDLREGGNGKWINTRNVLERLNGLGSQTN